ncbi:MAG: hypothetical protein ACJ761_03660 [Chloroflexota bacterium]
MTRLRRIAARLPGVREPVEVRFFVIVGAWALVLGIIYWFVSYEPAGTILLLALAAACLLAAGRLAWVARSVRRRPAAGVTGADASDYGVDEWPDRPFAEDEIRLPDETLAPLAVGLGIATCLTGTVFGLAPVAVGILPLVWGAWAWLHAAGDEWEAVDRSPGRRPDGESRG